MIGNVWEWTTDWYRRSPGSDPLNARTYGPSASLHDPPGIGQASTAVPLRRKVLKGGSYLSFSNAQRVRPTSRHPLRVDAAACDVGFRCVLRPQVSAATQCV